MPDKAYIARLEEENRNHRAIIAESGSRNPQLARELQEKIERNIVSIERAKADRE